VFRAVQLAIWFSGEIHDNTMQELPSSPRNSKVLSMPFLGLAAVLLLFFASPTSSCYTKKIAFVLELFQGTVVVQEENRYVRSL
jgi:hypothetical protein